MWKKLNQPPPLRKEGLYWPPLTKIIFFKSRMNQCETEPENPFETAFGVLILYLRHFYFRDVF